MMVLVSKKGLSIQKFIAKNLVVFGVVVAAATMVAVVAVAGAVGRSFEQ